MLNTFTLRANEGEVIDGINAILNMLENIGQPLFPRRIMTAAYSGAFTIDSLTHMYDAFKRANFQDCRISAYPPVNEETLFSPNLLLLDLDYDDEQVKTNGRTYADQIHKTKVNKILKRLQTKFHITNFMVVNTGNGRHILIPFGFDSPFEYIEEMRDILPYIMSSRYKRANNIMSESFLSFAKKYLSNNQADQGNHPNFASIFLRVPGTINMKMKYGTAEIVKIEHEWDYETELLNFGDLHEKTDIFYKYMTHMRLVAGKQLERKNTFRSVQSETRRWIEVLHNTAVSDCRKRILWLILAPYAINIKKMTHQDAFVWIKQWLDKCDRVYRIDSGFNVDEKIDYYLTVAKESEYLPISFKKLETDEWKMKGGINLSDMLKNKMSTTSKSVLYDSSTN